MTKAQNGNPPWKPFIDKVVRDARQTLRRVNRYEGGGLNTSYWEKRFEDVVNTMNEVEDGATCYYAGDIREPLFDEPKGQSFEIYLVDDGSREHFPLLFKLRKGDTNWESVGRLGTRRSIAHIVAEDWWRAFVTCRMFDHVIKEAKLQIILTDCRQLVFLE